MLWPSSLLCRTQGLVGQSTDCGFESRHGLVVLASLGKILCRMLLLFTQE